MAMIGSDWNDASEAIRDVTALPAATLSRVLAFSPQIVESIFGPEPSLKDMLQLYYLRAMTAKEATKCAEGYIQALRKEFGK